MTQFVFQQSVHTEDKKYSRIKLFNQSLRVHTTTTDDKDLISKIQNRNPPT